MLEFFYTIFLLRLSSQLLTKTIKSPQSFGNVLQRLGYVMCAMFGLMLYGTIMGKNISPKEIVSVVIAFPIVAIFVSVNIWGGSILRKVPQERYEQMHTFKGLGRGFLGVLVFFIFFASLNLIFGFLFLVGALFWLFLLIGSLGTVLLSKEYVFSNFVYVPEVFFKTEAQFFSYLHIDPFVFAFVLTLVVLLLPFSLSLWLILQKKNLVENN